MQFSSRLIALVSIIISVVSLSLASSVTSIAQAQTLIKADVLFIIQVRGEECCDKGTLPRFQQAVSTFQKRHIPAYFALRYDVLKNPKYRQYIQTIESASEITWGAYLEVTPQWAQDSQVKYVGNNENWHQAQHAFLIGYSPEDRKKLIATYMSEFKQTLGAYPTFSSAWMIDTPSLNSLAQDYGVKFHQITREQWGVDSYTLHGGPPHYPYQPSKNWLFEPDPSQDRELLIVRQTVTDPLYNYGDQTSAFTSQPNDYARDGKTITYFADLLTQALSGQPTGQRGFACLGLETSMEEKYWTEFEKQLDVITHMADKGYGQFPNMPELMSHWQKQTTSMYQGQDFVSNTPNQAFWITTPIYRVRLRRESNHIFISDIRHFDAQTPDPYIDRVASENGWWIAPYTLDSSRQNSEEKDTRAFLQRMLGPPTTPHLFQTPTNDQKLPLARIDLPASSTFLEVHKNGDLITVEYSGENNKPIKLVFTPENITLSSNQSVTPVIPIQDFFSPTLTQSESTFTLSAYLEPEKTNTLLAQTGYNCPTTDQCLFTFLSNSANAKAAREQLYPIYFPERINRPLDAQKTVTYVHNAVAIAGKNPVRIIFVPKDELGFAIKTPPVSVSTTPTIDLVRPTRDNTTEYQLVDLVHNTPVTTEVTLSLPGWEYKTTVTFAPDCKADMQYCLTHPLEAIWYIQAVIGNWLRKLLLNESQ